MDEKSIGPVAYAFFIVIFNAIKSILEEIRKVVVVIRKKKLLMLILVSWVILAQSIWAQNRSGYGSPLATYKTPEGFTITSYSDQWDTPSKLQAVRLELLSNTYAQEIGYLKNIYLYPDAPEGILGYTHYDIKRDRHGDYVYQDNAYIELFDTNEYKNTKDMARVLSHEYGHHFTTYYLVKKEKKFFDQWRTTGYAKARNIISHPKIRYAANEEGYLHRWDIMEIAAEDYVQLFGSLNARKSVVYKDIQQRIHEDISSAFNFKIGFNFQPQENSDLPLAGDVRGLEKYWAKMAGLVIKDENPPVITPQIRLVGKREVAKGHYQYRLEWDEIPNGGPYEYTLVAYPDGNHMMAIPIKTVYSGEEMHAFVGSALKTNPKTGKQQLILDDYTGKYQFNLLIKDSDHKVYKGTPLDVNFYYPVISNTGLYKDVHQLDWSYQFAAALANKKVMVGSPDEYFYPFQKVTYQELITLLDRCVAKDKSMPRGNFTTLVLDKDLITQKELNRLKIKQQLTRDDVAYLAYQYMILRQPLKGPINEITPFKDNANISNKDEVTYLYKKGVVKGMGGYYFPNNPMSRQELASILAGLLNH